MEKIGSPGNKLQFESVNVELFVVKDWLHFKMGRRQGGPSRPAVEGAYLKRYVTDEQRSRRPIFNATLRAAAGWLFFRVARSLHIDLDMLVARALKNSQLTCGETQGI